LEVIVVQVERAVDREGKGELVLRAAMKQLHGKRLPRPLSF
jgi:hypothetical protein